jgi:TonB family protein
MKRLLQVVAGAGLALMCVSACSSRAYANGDKKKTQDVEALFARAKALENLEAPDTPPYLLRIHVVGLGQLSAYPEGTYTTRFLSPAQFRQDRVFGNRQFSAGANGDAKKQWSSGRTSLGLLEAVFMAVTSYAYDDPTAYGDPAAPEQWRKADFNVTTLNKDGLTMTCAERRIPTYWQVCFDATTGAAVAALDDSGLLFQYSDFEEWGTHLVPKRAIVFANNAPILEADVETLEALPAAQSQVSAFMPPSDATLPSRPPPDCKSDTAHLIKEVKPDYPRSAGSPKNGGVVVFWGIINETGNISEVIIVNSAGTAFDEAALAAVKQSQYRPATVCSEPVAIEGSFRVVFR